MDYIVRLAGSEIISLKMSVFFKIPHQLFEFEIAEVCAQIPPLGKAGITEMDLAKIFAVPGIVGILVKSTILVEFWNPDIL